MARLSLIKPTDQPPGTRRLINDLDRALADPRYDQLKWIVAYAKSGPLLRLRGRLEAWRAGGKSSAAIFGIDQCGTSKEALELALLLFDEVYTTQEAGLTFHPKIYLFEGTGCAEVFIGSNNLTVGGTEKNFEAAVRIELDPTEDANAIADVLAAWTDLLPANFAATEQLDAAALAQLVAERTVLPESETWKAAGADDAKVGRGRQGRRSGILIRPESPLPPDARRARTVTRKVTGPAPIHGTAAICCGFHGFWPIDSTGFRPLIPLRIRPPVPRVFAHHRRKSPAVA